MLAILALRLLVPWGSSSDTSIFLSSLGYSAN
jgi:hypothetical protein